MQHITGLYGWLKNGFSASTVITVLGIAAGLAITHGKDAQRIDDLERRITVSETNSVKRSEFEAREEAIYEQLRSIDGHMQMIERTLLDNRK
jgi:hypothetical protein